MINTEDRVSDLRQGRRLEMMNGSKPCGPSGGFQAPSPKRRRPRPRVSCSPSPHPSPQGEGETFVRAFIMRPSLVVVCLQNDGQKNGDCNRNVRISQCRGSALPLLGERDGVRGNEATSNPRRTTIPGTVKLALNPITWPLISQFVVISHSFVIRASLFVIYCLHGL
jgi:hypothetical protein